MFVINYFLPKNLILPKNFGRPIFSTLGTVIEILLEVVYNLDDNSVLILGFYVQSRIGKGLQCMDYNSN